MANGSFSKKGKASLGATAIGTAAASRATPDKLIAGGLKLSAIGSAAALSSEAISTARRKAEKQFDETARAGTNASELKRSLAAMPVAKRRETAQRIARATNILKR